MSVWASFRLSTPGARGNACRAIMDVPDGHIVEIREATRSNLANRALHAALTDLAKQFKWQGQSLSVTIWKRLCTGAMLREQGKPVTMIPALDGNGFEVIYEPTSKMGVKMMSDLIEWVYAFGTQNGVVFRDRKRQ